MISLDTIICNDNYGMYSNGTFQSTSYAVSSGISVSLRDIYVQGIAPSLFSYFPNGGFISFNFHVS